MLFFVSAAQYLVRLIFLAILAILPPVFFTFVCLLPKSLSLRPILYISASKFKLSPVHTIRQTYSAALYLSFELRRRQLGRLQIYGPANQVPAELVTGDIIGEKHASVDTASVLPLRNAVCKLKN